VEAEPDLSDDPDSLLVEIKQEHFTDNDESESLEPDKENGDQQSFPLSSSSLMGPDIQDSGEQQEGSLPAVPSLSSLAGPAGSRQQQQEPQATVPAVRQQQLNLQRNPQDRQALENRIEDVLKQTLADVLIPQVQQFLDQQPLVLPILYSSSSSESDSGSD
jgi:hypothetical protein